MLLFWDWFSLVWLLRNLIELVCLYLNYDWFVCLTPLRLVFWCLEFVLIWFSFNLLWMRFVVSCWEFCLFCMRNLGYVIFWLCCLLLNFGVVLVVVCLIWASLVSVGLNATFYLLVWIHVFGSCAFDVWLFLFYIKLCWFDWCFAVGLLCLLGFWDFYLGCFAVVVIMFVSTQCLCVNRYYVYLLILLFWCLYCRIWDWLFNFT